MPPHGSNTNRVNHDKKLFGARIAKWCVYLLTVYPILNYTLEMVFPHSIGLIWDRIVLILLASIALVRYLNGHRVVGFHWARFANWYIVYCIALLLVGLVKNPSVAFDGFSMDIEYIIFGLLLPFVVDTEDIPAFMYSIVAVSILLGFDGIYQYITKVPVPTSWSDIGESVRTRVFSVLKSPAELGANMEMAIPFLFAMLIVDKHRVRRWLYGFGELCCVGTLLFTYNRGAWLGLGVGLLLVAIVYDRRLLIALVVFGTMLFFLPPIHHRIMDLFSPVYVIKSAQGGRLMRWQAAFQTMAAHPFFGAGLGRYGGAIATAKHFSLYSDSYYAKILGESGLLGLVLFFGMHIAIVRELIQTVVKRATGANRVLALGGVAGVIAILIHSSVENLYEYAPTVLLYYLMVGLLLMWGRTLSSADTQPLPRAEDAV